MGGGDGGRGEGQGMLKTYTELRIISIDLIRRPVYDICVRDINILCTYMTRLGIGRNASCALGDFNI